MADDDCLTGLYFSDQKNYLRLLEKDNAYRENNILKYASEWLDSKRQINRRI